MIEPVLADEVLWASCLAASADESTFHLWWLGQSGFLLSWNGQRLLFDPYLSDSLTTKYADTDKPHVRMTRRPIDPARLLGIKLCLVSHGHTDHLDGATLVPLLAKNPRMTLVAPTAISTLLTERTQTPRTQQLLLNAGQTATVGPFRVTAVPAAHETFDIDANGNYPYLGYIVQFGRFAVFHAGDTIEYHEQVALLKQQPIDVALLPINGRKPERRVQGNLWGDEAAELAKAAGVGLVIPCHYEMFTFNTESPELFVNTCDRLDQPFQVLRCGEHFSWG